MTMIKSGRVEYEFHSAFISSRPAQSSAYSIGSLDFWWGWDWVFPTTTCCRSADARAGRSIPRRLICWNVDGKRFLVAPRGRTQWVRNAEAAGEVTLKKGSKRQQYRLRALSDQEKPEILKAYLDQFKREVQRYFPVPAGSPVEAFRELVQSYPAFELIST